MSDKEPAVKMPAVAFVVGLIIMLVVLEVRDVRQRATPDTECSDFAAQYNNSIDGLLADGTLTHTDFYVKSSGIERSWESVYGIGGTCHEIGATIEHKKKLTARLEQLGWTGR